MISAKQPILLTCLLSVLSLTFINAQKGYCDQDFRSWIENFSTVAQREGIEPAVYARAFAGVDTPDADVLDKARYQPEFTTEIWDYLDARVNQRTVRSGQEKGNEHALLLAGIKRDFGVSPSVVLAIWSMETAYGAILSRTDRLHYVPRALATLGYADRKREKFARSQLIAALKILQQKDIDEQGMLGSWAGAMGHTQFIPTSYLAYGVDYDGDGKRDIWNSIPDALSTAANLLKNNNWQKGKTWGYEVVLPDSKATTYVGKTMKLRQWEQLGFQRPTGKVFPRPSDNAVLKLPAGPEGPAFLVLKNFYVLKRYNNSDYYAFAVGLLSDRIAGYKGLVQDWPRPSGSLSSDQKFELQTLLKKHGYYAGEIDGNCGSGTRGAIRDFQSRAGEQSTGEVTLEILVKLRKI